MVIINTESKKKIQTQMYLKIRKLCLRNQLPRKALFFFGVKSALSLSPPPKKLLPLSLSLSLTSENGVARRLVFKDQRASIIKIKKSLVWCGPQKDSRTCLRLENTRICLIFCWRVCFLLDSITTRRWSLGKFCFLCRSI